jgi:cell wall-associated NlpC family hydrolase
MICKKSALRVVSFFAVLFMFAAVASAQVFQRPRVVPPSTSTSAPTTSSTSQNPTVPSIQRPILTNKLVVSNAIVNAPALVKKIVSSAPVNASAAANFYGLASAVMAFNQKLKFEMDSRVGIPYLYGSTSGRTYDCSGLVWSVFQAAGAKFARSSARTYWSEFEPVSGDDRFKFGTIVFLNNLGHMGIVVDENGFYHASSSKGVTYSPFAGYWGKRVVGFRRIPASYFQK